MSAFRVEAALYRCRSAYDRETYEYSHYDRAWRFICARINQIIDTDKDVVHPKLARNMGKWTNQELRKEFPSLYPRQKSA